MLKRLAIVTTHPIQYNAPLFKLLTKREKILVRVFYTWGETVLDNKFDPGFGKKINWDIPLLEGYDYVFERNIALSPGSHHFKGIDNPGLINDILDFKADAVLIYGWSFKSHLECLRYFHKKIPVLFRGDSTLLDESSGIKKMARRIFLKWVYRHVDRALYVGTANKAYYRRHGLKEKQLAFAPHTVDNDRFKDDAHRFEHAALEWRKQLDIPDRAIVFLYAGKFENKKDPFLLLNAFCKIDDRNARLLMVGNGVLENQLKERAKGDDRIKFIDFQNQSLMPVVYRLADVFVLPSKGPGETWGLGVNEAMASGRAVIVSNKSGCAIDLLENGRNGYIFEAGNCTDLSKKMEMIIEQGNEVKNMGDHSLNKIQDWNLDKVAHCIANLLNVDIA